MGKLAAPLRRHQPGTWWLSPALILPLLSGQLPNTGSSSQKLALPKDPNLVGVPLYFQGIQVAGAAASIGTLHSYPLIN